MQIYLEYFQNAFSEIIHFLQIQGVKNSSIEEIAVKSVNEIVSTTKSAVEYALSRRKTYSIDVDVKSPYIIFPEYGSLQNGGNVLVLDVGGLRISSEPGTMSELEGATRMEKEERLYDRLTVSISQLQVLFSDSGDEWRAMRSRDDSDLHLLPRLRVRADLANSIFPEYRDQPQQKMDFHITPIKLNMSENRLTHLVEFFNHFPVPEINFQSDDVDSPCENYDDLYQSDFAPESDMSCLFHTMQFLSLDNMLTTNKINSTPPSLQKIDQKKSVDDMSQTSLELQLYFPSSETSDDDVDSGVGAMKGAIDVSGFDDNISPHNVIKILTRFCIDEITLGLSRSNDQGDRPYLMLKLSHIVLETAHMDYGPAFQVTMKSVHLVDKFYLGPNGEYLELISSPQMSSVLTVLYRKVDAKCPDFASHFHSTEQSLIINISTLNVVWHRGSISTLTNFINHMATKFNDVNQRIPDVEIKGHLPKTLFKEEENTPIPSGAVKWSLATHFTTLNLKMCDNDVDIMEARLTGLVGKCLFKANERKTFSACLTDLVIDDLSDITLHNRIVEKEDEVIFDIKYDELSPSVTEDNKEVAQKPEVYLDIRVGRMQIVFLCKFVADLQRFIFFEPLVSKEKANKVLKKSEEIAELSIQEKLLRKRVIYHIDVQAPTILIPQKSDSPSLLVLNLGDLKVENMFTDTCVENILLEFGPFQLSRAVLTLAGGLEMQEAILEPVKIRSDIKHFRTNTARDHNTWDINMNLGTLRVNLGQRDLNTIIAVLGNNKSEGQFGDEMSCSRPSTPDDHHSPDETEESLGKLQAFLTSVDIYKVVNACLYLDATTVTLYTDMDEILSSPVRDAATALAKIDLGEVEVKGDMNSNRNIEIRFMLASCNIFDVRPDSNNIAKKLFGQYDDIEIMHFGGVNVTSPQLIDATYSVNANGDASFEITLERTRLNVSVNFCMSLYKYVNDSIPSPCTTNGLLNPCYIEDPSSHVDGIRISQRPPSSSNSTSGYLSTVTSSNGNTTVATVSIHLKPPEFVVFAEPEKFDSQILVLSFETNIDYSSHPLYEDWKIHLQNIKLLAANYSDKKQMPYPLVQSFDILCEMSNRPNDDEEKIEIMCSPVLIHISPAIISILKNLKSELADFTEPSQPFITLKLPSADLEDLWTPKKLSANTFPSDPQDEIPVTIKFPPKKGQQQMTIKLKDIQIYLEDQTSSRVLTILQVIGNFSAEINDWKSQMYSTNKLKLAINFYNDEYSEWEPILEPAVSSHSPKQPVEITVKTMKYPAQSIGVRKLRSNFVSDSADAGSSFVRSSSYLTLATRTHCSGSSSGSEDDQSDSEMVVLKAPRASKMNSTHLRSNIDLSSMAGMCQLFRLGNKH